MAALRAHQGDDVDFDPPRRVAVELEEPLHRMRGRSSVPEGRERSDRSGQAHQRAPPGYDFHLGAHPGSDDRHACHDPTPAPESVSDSSQRKREAGGLEQNFQRHRQGHPRAHGLNKKETADKFGDEKVKEWRRSYDIPPPNGEES